VDPGLARARIGDATLELGARLLVLAELRLELSEHLREVATHRVLPVLKSEVQVRASIQLSHLIHLCAHVLS